MIVESTESQIKHECPNIANAVLYEVPTYLAGCPIGTLNRKTKRKKSDGKN